MDNFYFCSPTAFVFGKNTQKEVGKYVKKFGGKKVLLHYGGGSIKKNGLFDQVIAALMAEDINFVELGGVRPNPVSSMVYQGIELCKKEQVDFVLAVGGGSVIDSAKAIAAGAVYDGDFLEFFAGKYIQKALPIGTILTIPAAGSEGSFNTVITNEKTGFKGGATGEAIRPAFSILNPELTFTLPKYQSACGITDIIAHIFERYFTPTKNVEITDRFCEAVLLTMIQEAPRVIADSKDYDAQANIMWAGMVAHNNLCGVGRAQDWSTHGLEHQLSALYDVAHGAGLAVMFPAWMRYTLDVDVNRYAQLAVRVWGCTLNEANPKETALAGIACFEKFLQAIGMPTSFQELAAKPQDIPFLVSKLGITDQISMGTFMPLFAKDAQAIYELAVK